MAEERRALAGKEGKPLRLRARDVEDLAVISAMVQDAIVPLGDMAFLAEERSFVLALNRFRWEAEHAAGKGGERVHAGLRFDRVRKVQLRGIDRRNRGQFLELLAVAYDKGTVMLHFAGGGLIRLLVDDLVCALEDFDEPWPTVWRPRHDD